MSRSDKYIHYNFEKLANRILQHEGRFSPREFMALRYACCDAVAYSYRKLKEWKPYESKFRPNNNCKRYKGYINQFQQCIAFLDKKYEER